MDFLITLGIAFAIVLIIGIGIWIDNKYPFFFLGLSMLGFTICIIVMLLMSIFGLAHDIAVHFDLIKPFLS